MIATRNTMGDKDTASASQSTAGARDHSQITLQIMIYGHGTNAPAEGEGGERECHRDPWEREV